MRRSRSLLLALVLPLALSACASRYKIDAEAPTYAAQAKIKVKVNKTDNRELYVQVDHLAPPSRIDPALQAYVVWIAVPGHGVTKAGRLEYDEKHRRGRLMATTPHPKFEVIISLERDPSTAQPGPQVIVRKVVAHT